MVLWQQASAEKSNENAALPDLLATLALEGSIVTIDGIATPNIAQSIRDRGAGYILSVKDSQPTSADSMQEFLNTFQLAPDLTPNLFDALMEKNHDRMEVRHCCASDQIDCLHAFERWPELKAFAVIASERTIKGKTSLEYRFCITSLQPDADRLN
jgi:predicted transposase YbfD/YdcC